MAKVFTTMNFGRRTQEYILGQFNGSDPVCMSAKRKKYFTKNLISFPPFFSPEICFKLTKLWFKCAWVHDFSPTVATLKSTFPHTWIRSHLHSYLAEYRTVCLISITEVLLEQTKIISHPQSVFLHALISLFNIIVH